MLSARLLAPLMLASSACWLDLDKLSAEAPGPGGDVLQCNPCPAGGCAPGTVANGASLAFGAADVAVSEDGLYWVNQEGGEVMRFPSGAIKPEALTKASAPRSIAVSAGQVFYTDDTGVWNCAASDCEATKKQIAAPAAIGTLARVAFDGSSVYWADRGASPAEGRILGCDPANCASPKTYASAMLFPEDIVTSAGLLFWAERGDGNVNGNVVQATPGGATTIISSALVFPTSVAVDNDAVYYPQSQQGGTVKRCLQNAYCNEPANVATAQSEWKPFDVAVSGGRVYWSDASDGTIKSCPTPSCGAEAPTIHATNRSGISRIALGTTCIFWVDAADGGSVMSVGR